MKSALDYLLGKTLSNTEENEQKIGPVAGIPLLGLDALSSSAYGPEAAATVLIALGAAGVQYVVPITACIILLTIIVYFSYRQTVAAYPCGGGSYTVAKENLGTFPGLLAAAALLLDYILVVAVGISAGVGALISAVPVLQPHTLALCLCTLGLVTMVNLRGLKESGSAFILPTFAFIVSMLGVLAYGIFQTFMTGGHPVALAPQTAGSTHATEVFSLWLIARAFASGCTAMTGVEAVSNGVKVFQEPVVKHARQTLTYIIGILILLLAGIAYLAQAYGISATDPGMTGYQSLISLLVSAIVGKGIIYYFTIGSVIAVLMLSANTGFADFPRMCQLIAKDNFLPHIFAERGRRLVFSYGIMTIALLSGLLLVVFEGVTDNLIPLFAIGAFLAFTLSQAGMVGHWIKNWSQPRTESGGRPVFSIIVNGLGALATFVTLVVVLVSKFTEGGWITTILIAGMMFLFYGVRKHYFGVAQEVKCAEPLNFDQMRHPVVLVPVRGWSRITRKAMRFALNISDEIYGVHVDDGEGTSYIDEQWNQFVVEPAKASGAVCPKLVKLQNPYRRLFGSLLDFITVLENQYPDRQIAVLIPGLVEKKWYHYFLHNQRAILLAGALRMRADSRVIVISVPWYF